MLYLLVSLAAAAELTPTAGLYGGYYLTPEANPIGSGGEIVGRLGLRVLDPLDIEVEVGRVDAFTRELHINYHLWNPRFGALLHLTPNRRFDAFLGVGTGFQHVTVARDSSAESPGAQGQPDRALYRNPSLDYVLDAGPGVTVHLLGPLHIRSDLRWYGSFGADPTDEHADVFQNLEWTVGLDFRAEASADRDHDHIPNRADACPDDPEDRDGFEDSDGCPELDNDQDGITDSADACPTDAEDADGFEDTNGCPDPDNDADGLLDAADRCPDQAEDVDAFDDEDGCPDPDNDADGVPDAADNCVNDPETANGFEDGDGCPDTVPADIQEFTGAIRGINFDTNKSTIRADSEATLREALAVLKDHPTLRIEVQGHTDDVGDDRFNLELSERRAGAVVDWFIIQGVDASRLRSVGYGELRPVAENTSDTGRAQNRRVEFRLLGEEGK